MRDKVEFTAKSRLQEQEVNAACIATRSSCPLSCDSENLDLYVLHASTAIKSDFLTRSCEINLLCRDTAHTNPNPGCTHTPAKSNAFSAPEAIRYLNQVAFRWYHSHPSRSRHVLQRVAIRTAILMAMHIALPVQAPSTPSTEKKALYLVNILGGLRHDLVLWRHRHTSGPEGILLPCDKHRREQSCLLRMSGFEVLLGGRSRAVT